MFDPPITSAANTFIIITLLIVGALMATINTDIFKTIVLKKGVRKEKTADEQEQSESESL